MSLVKHAKRELRLAGLFDNDSDYNGMIGDAVMELIKILSKQGCNGWQSSMLYYGLMNLREWALAQGIHPQTAYRWYREGNLRDWPETHASPGTVGASALSDLGPPEGGTDGRFDGRVTDHRTRLRKTSTSSRLRLVRREPKPALGRQRNPARGASE
jgi:hypothetical protein